MQDEITYTTVGERITRRSMTCHIPNEALRVHNHQLDFMNLSYIDSNFSSLPPGGAHQIYTVSVSNNGRDFGSSQTFTVYNSTCMSCSRDGVVQRVCQLFVFSDIYLRYSTRFFIPKCRLNYDRGMIDVL